MFNVVFLSVFTNKTRASLLIYFTNMPTLMPPTMFVADGISCVIENIKLSSSAGIDEINLWATWGFQAVGSGCPFNNRA
uniref:Putative secreted protein n=1 Tax=Ixodes ricinus TaxID=34613 RepID=A0A6B0TXM0_IXORI